MTDFLTAANFSRLVLVLAVASVGYYAGQSTAPQPDALAPDTVTVAEPMAPSDLLDATTPTQVTTYEAPDTSDTRTECIEVPTWMQPFSISDTGRASTTPSGTHGASLGMTQPAMPSPPSPTRSYVITPTIQGSPNLSVGAEQVRLQGFTPSGAGREWTYDVPQEQWHLWPAVEIRTTPSGLQASALANLRWRKVTVSAGYMQAAQARGLAFGIELRPFTISW